MIPKDSKYEEGLAIEYYNRPAFMQIPTQYLIDIIPTIVETNREEMKILESWKDHFRQLAVPFAICRKVVRLQDRDLAYLSLWKRRRA